MTLASTLRSRAILVVGALLAVLALSALAVRGGALYRARMVQGSTMPGIKAQFSLTTSAGRAVSDRTYRGKWLVVYFGFTVCPEACPTTLLSIGRALDALGPAATEIQPLFITIDPARDTPAVMTRYLTSFDPRIVGLVGTPDQLAAANKNYRVYEQSRERGPGDYSIDHSSFLYLVNPRGEMAKILTGDLPGHALADELQHLIR